NKRKRLSKIKGKEKAHPYSRKARQISRAMTKEANISKAKSDRIGIAMARGQKVYLNRNREQVDELEEKRNTVRGLSPKETLFLQVTETEAKEAKLSGIDVPDLTNGLVVKTLRIWDGDVNSITTIKLVNCKPL
ncbi:hypothetical protein BX667DRAFT_473853, partial [Coemansia mojavensis]